MTFFRDKMPHLVREIAGQPKRKARQRAGASTPNPVKDIVEAPPLHPAETSSSLPVSTEMHRIYADRRAILADIGWSVERSVIGDGSVHHLRANHEVERVEHMHLLGDDKILVHIGLRRLAGLFPEPPAPGPEPRRPRDYPSLADMLAMRPKARPH